MLSYPKSNKPESMVTLAYNLTQEAETGEMPRIQGQLVLCSSRTGAIVRHCLKKAKTNQTNNNNNKQKSQCLVA